MSFRFAVVETSQAQHAVDDVLRGASAEDTFRATQNFGEQAAFFGEEQNLLALDLDEATALVRYRGGFPEAAGVWKALGSCRLQYVEASPRKIVELGAEERILAPQGHFRGAPQTLILDPMAHDVPSVERLLQAASTCPDIQSPFLMNVLTGAASFATIGTTFDTERVDAVLETGRVMSQGTDLTPAGASVFRHRDFGKVAFGPYGRSYPRDLERDAIRLLATTDLGRVEILRAQVMTTMALWQSAPSYRRVNCTWSWISAVLSFVYARERTYVPSRVFFNAWRIYWLTTLDAIKAELWASGFLQNQGDAVVLSRAGSAYLSEVLIPALSGNLRWLLDAVPEAVNGVGLFGITSPRISAAVTEMGDKRFRPTQARRLDLS